jgi:hypothetical protein
MSQGMKKRHAQEILGDRKENLFLPGNQNGLRRINEFRTPFVITTCSKYCDMIIKKMPKILQNNLKEEFNEDKFYNSIGKRKAGIHTQELKRIPALVPHVLP